MRIEKVIDVEDKEEFWNLYKRSFTSLNEKTPINQMFTRRKFFSFLKNPQVIKFVARDGGKLVAFGLMTDRLELDPWVSVPFFKRNYPSPVFEILVLAVDKNFRSSNIGFEMLRRMMEEIPGYGIFFHSRLANPLIPRLAEMSGRGNIEGGELDAEVLCVYRHK